jgi:hypothetical protein
LNKEEVHGFAYDNPMYGETEWENGNWSVQRWLERTPWRTLKGTKFGRDADEAGPHPSIMEDPLLRQVCLIDLATFITAERVSVKSVSGMINLAPDDASRGFLCAQVLDEARHYEVFCRRMADYGVNSSERSQYEERVTTKSLASFYDLIEEQVDKGDFVAATLAQNITMEGLAYPLYRYEIRYWQRFDPGLSKIIMGAFADESNHVTFGEAIVRDQLRGMGNAKRNNAIKLLKDLQSLMCEAFDDAIKYHIGLYQAAANNHMELVGDVEIFPGRYMRDTDEETQTKLVLEEIKVEQRKRMCNLGIDIE